MKKIEVAPRTPAWHQYRNERWTASAAATLVCGPNARLLRDYAAEQGVALNIEPLLEVGIDDYFGNTLWSVWAEKVGRIPRFQGNAHTARGTKNEAAVVHHFESTKLMVVDSDVTAVSSSEDWLLASFDAVAPASSDAGVQAPYGFPVEAKCPAFQSRRKLWESRKDGRMAVMGLPYYWCQVQHQIAVAEAPYGWFVAAGVEPNGKTGVAEIVFPLVEKVPRDDLFLEAYLAVAKFYWSEFIDGGVEPPMLPSDHELLARLEETAAFDRAVVEADHTAAVALYLEAVRQEGVAESRRKELEAKVIAAASAMRAEGTDMVVLGSRLRITFASSTSTSWQKVAKELVKLAGLTAVPTGILAECESKPKESIKIKELL